MIPKIIHYCWFGKNPIPQEYQRYIQGWKKLCPDYEIKCWDETNYDYTKNTYMKQAYEAKKWGFVSDYVGYDVVYREGGIYLDTDVELVKNLDNLLNNQVFMGIESNENGYRVAPGLAFGAEKNNQDIKNLRDEYNDISFINQDGSLNLLSIPIYATEYFENKGFIEENKFQELSDGVKIYPTEYFSPMNFLTGKIYITDKTYSVHHYSASWQSKTNLRHIAIIRKVNNVFGEKLGKYINLVLRITWGISRRIKQHLLRMKKND